MGGFLGQSEQVRERAREVYRRLNDSPMQRRLRAASPCWVGAVHWNPQEESYASLVREMKRIRAAGFTFVRFHCIDPIVKAPDDFDFRYPDLRMDAARRAGLLVFPHMSFRRLRPACLRACGLAAGEAETLGFDDPRVERAFRMFAEPVVKRYRGHPALAAWPLAGEPNATPIALKDDADRARFRAWLQGHYAAPADIHRAWALYPRVRRDSALEPGRKPLFIGTWDDAVAVAAAIEGREAGGGLALATTALRHEIYGTMHDLVRFRADEMLADVRREVEILREYDRRHPVCVGSHQLFYNNPLLGWDTDAFGRLADMNFTSIHLSWHFEHVGGEVNRPVYMQARMTADAFKGGATSAYETTGGPVQYSGGYGNHMDAGLMRRLMFSYLAAGNEIIAFWDWKPRPGGIESGEYGLVTLSGRVSEWAREAGRVAGAMGRYAREIWRARGEPELALVRSWDSELVLGVEPPRFDLKDAPSDYSRGPGHQHMKALIGASRAAIDGQVAYEYLSEKEVLAGLAAAYPTVYLPHVRACGDALLESLLAYVEQGGRLIADVQLGFQDPWGKVRPRGEGTVLDRLFGAWVDTIHDARTRPQSVDGLAVNGFFGELAVTSARVIRRFDTGKPAVTEATIGRGQAVLIGFDPARDCWQPGNAAAQEFLADLYRGPFARRWWCSVPQTVRRTGEAADHWFIVNDGPARSAVLRVFDRDYASVEDVVEGVTRPVEGTISVEVPAWSGVWLRCARRKASANRAARRGGRRAIP